MSLQANNITFKYFENSKKSVFEQLNFTIPQGKTTLLTGRSGCGKSTLAYVLAGLYPENAGVLTAGNVTVDGVDLATLTPNKRVKFVTMMFQNPDLQFCMNNIEQELEFCLENIGVAEVERPKQIDHAIKLLKIDHLRQQPFTTLSGGEKQKCALACIVALKSQYIILDEAFANIDPAAAKEIINVLRKLNLSILAIDHNIELWDGNYDQIINFDGQHPHANFDLIAKLHQPGSTIIQTKKLVINGISYPDITIKKGSINAIVGPSGAGKTTWFKTLIRQYRYKGSLTIANVQVKQVKKIKLFAKIGIVFQNPANQFLALTVFDEVLFSVKRWYQDQSVQWQEEKVIELLTLFKLVEQKKYAPYMLSQGQQRRLAVLTMIAGAQDILLLDEPTYGQDYENICAMMELLVAKAQTGLTVIFATHNLTVAKKFSHQIIRIGEANE